MLFTSKTLGCRAVLAAGLLGMIGCGSHHDAKPAVTADDTSDDTIVIVDPTTLDARMTDDGTSVPFDVTSTATASGLNLVLGLTPPTITQAGTLSPPTSGGVTLQANSIVMNGSFAYVSYNVQGSTPAGAIDVVDMTNPAAPKLVSEAIFPTSDINGLQVESGFLYAVGATSSGSSTAYLSKITLASGLLTSTVTTVPLTSYAGTSVDISSTLVFATSGDTGGVQIFNKATMAPVATLAIADARWVTYSTTDSAAWVTSGQPGKLTQVSPAGASLKTIAIGGDTVADSKSTVQELNAGALLSSIGDGGAAITCKSSGTALASIAPVTVAGLAASKSVTNAATFLNSAAGTYVFTADGEAGVYGNAYTTLSGLGLCLGLTLGLSGHFSLGAGNSANSVYASGTNLFVSSGLAGVKILNLSFPIL